MDTRRPTAFFARSTPARICTTDRSDALTCRSRQLVLAPGTSGRSGTRCRTSRRVMGSTLLWVVEATPADDRSECMLVVLCRTRTIRATAGPCDRRVGPASPACLSRTGWSTVEWQLGVRLRSHREPPSGSHCLVLLRPRERLGPCSSFSRRPLLVAAVSHHSPA